MNYNFETNEIKKGFNFKKSMVGYDTNEVNSYIGILIKKIQKLEEENINLSNSISDYSKNNDFLKKILIRAEETALNLKTEAENESKLIIEEAKNKANDIVSQAKLEANNYRDNIQKQFFGYERNLKNIVDNFYILARKNIKNLEKELIEEVNSSLKHVNKTYSPTNNDTVFNNNETENKQENKDNVTNKEYLVGKVLLKDITDKDGYIVVKKETIVTPQLIEYLNDKGLYQDLFISIDY